MKKEIYINLLLTIIGLSVPVFAQQMPEIEALNRVILNHKDSIIYAAVMPVEDQAGVHPRTTRMYYWYAQHDIKNSRGNFSGKLLHGNYTAYYSDKSLKTKGKFKKGVRHGKWAAWNTKGEYQWRMRYKKGLRKGRFYEYNPEGMLVRKGRFKRKEKEVQVKYYENGTRVKKETADDQKKPEKIRNKNKKDKTRGDSKSDSSPTEEKKPKEKKSKKNKDGDIKIKKGIFLFPQKAGKST